MMQSKCLVEVPQTWVHRLWPAMYRGVVACLAGTPVTPSEVLRRWLSEDRPQLFAVRGPKGFCGFVTFRVLDLNHERWGYVEMLWLVAGTPREVLAEGTAALRRLAIDAACTHLNFVSPRSGFTRWARRLGFRPRLVEWTQDLREVI